MSMSEVTFPCSVCKDSVVLLISVNIEVATHRLVSIGYMYIIIYILLMQAHISLVTKLIAFRSLVSLLLGLLLMIVFRPSLFMDSREM